LLHFKSRWKKRKEKKRKEKKERKKKERKTLSPINIQLLTRGMVSLI